MSGRAHTEKNISSGNNFLPYCLNSITESANLSGHTLL